MSFLIAFIGGIITFISPCVLPLIPMYIAYTSGISVRDLKTEGSRKSMIKIFIHFLVFVIGFAVVFSSLAAIFYIFVQWLGIYKIWFNRAGGIIIILFGLHIMGVINIKFLNYEARIHTKAGKSSLPASFLIGIAFGAGWTPCVGPILSSILFTSTASRTPILAVLLLLTYSLGLGIPFLLTGLLTDRILGVFDAVKRHYKTVEIISGIFLVVLGLLLFFDLLGFLSGWLSGILPDTINLESKIIR